MTNNDHSKQVLIASGVNALLGVWLVISPLVYLYPLENLESVWSGVLVGMLIALIGIWRSRSPRENAVLSWVNIALGSFIALAPWIFDNLDGAPLWNNLFVGIVVVVFATWSGRATVVTRRQANA